VSRAAGLQRPAGAGEERSPSIVRTDAMEMQIRQRRPSSNEDVMLARLFRRRPRRYAPGPTVDFTDRRVALALRLMLPR
jgi:hypothetical protein